ncbi:MAG: hypothetical protein HZA91_06320 [Verrucomicrobia bacterium]|nr:hypothetical protein [Verrucomicrobiota bacterium]
MFRTSFCGLLIAAAALAGAAELPRPARPGTPVRPGAPGTNITTNTTTNQPAHTIGFSTRRLSTSSGVEATIREMFQGTVRLLADDRVEFSYDFTLRPQLDDFAPEPGDRAPTFGTTGFWAISDGFMQKGMTNDVPLFHRARFVGPVTVAFKGFLLKGLQYTAGFYDTEKRGQMQAGVGGKPLVMFLGENGKVVADAPQVPLSGKVQDLIVNFDETNFAIGPVGWKPLTAPRRVGHIGQVFWAAPDASVALDDLKITGRLDLDWYRAAVDVRLTKEFQGRVGPRYGPPPCTESQLRQMIRGFQRILGDGKIELRYDFADTAQFADWRVNDARGAADPHAWRVYDGVLHKSQFGPTWITLLPPLAGPIKVSARAAIVSGTEAGMGLRDVEANLLCGFKLGAMGWFLGDDSGQRARGLSTGLLLNQFHTLELDRGESNVVARLDTRSALRCATNRREPFNVVLTSLDSTAVFDDVYAVGYLDYDWCVRQLRLHGFKESTLPGGLVPGVKRTDAPGKLAQSVSFASSSHLKVQSNADWQDTRITLRQGDKVNIAASGSYKFEKASAAVTAVGLEGETLKNRPPCPKLTPCALVGRIGFGEPFLIGAEKEFVAQEMGNLSLRVNEQPLYDNTGALDVEIVVIPVAK